MYDITLTGSLVNSGTSLSDALRVARGMSEFTFPGRLLRVHDVDGETVLAEYRDGKLEEFAL